MRFRELTWLAPAKLNLALRIVGRRSDGYHLLDSVMVPIDVFDELRVRLVREPGCRVELRSIGLPELLPEHNLAFRAARLFLEHAAEDGRVEIELKKHIPAGAGLGGGSSDAAAVLLALDRLFDTRLDASLLAEWGAELGADVPFFIYARPARVRGIGEIVEPLPAFPRPPLVVAHDHTGVSTAAVYGQYDRALTKREAPPIKDLFADPQVPLQEWMANDLEMAASRIQPGIPLLKRRLLNLGALAVVMTGSGSAVFGVFEETETARAAAARLQADGIWGRAVAVLDRRSETGRQ